MIIGLIPKMPKFTQLIFEHCYINCLLIKIWENPKHMNFGILRPKRRKIQVNFPGQGGVVQEIKKTGALAPLHPL